LVPEEVDIELGYYINSFGAVLESQTISLAQAEIMF
jgi:hypothetical protein